MIGTIIISKKNDEVECSDIRVTSILHSTSSIIEKNQKEG